MCLVTLQCMQYSKLLYIQSVPDALPSTVIVSLILTLQLTINPLNPKPDPNSKLNHNPNLTF